MTKFITFVAKILFTLIVILVVLDWAYTTVYLHSYYRGKVHYSLTRRDRSTNNLPS